MSLKIKREHTKSKKEGKKDLEVKELKEENKHLRREINELKAEIDILKGSASRRTSDRTVRTFEQHSQNERLFSKKRYSSYVFALIRRTSLFYVYSRIINVVRRYTFLTTTLKILTAILIFVQSSAVFALSASFLVFYLPFALLISYSTIILTFFKSKKANKQNRKRLENKKIFIFFPPKGYAFDKNSFFYSTVHAQAQNKDVFCIIVSPYFFSSRGLNETNTKSYLTSRLEGDNILIVRRHYYFSLKKHVLRYFHSNITEIY